MAVRQAKVPPAMAITDIGRLEVVRIADLNVDPSYQRDLKPDLVERIAREWDIVAANSIVVSRRESGKEYIVNGQNHTAAAERVGESEVLAQVVVGYTRAEEASLRLRLNNRGADTSQERFKAQVASGDPESLAIVAICEEFDTRMNESPETNAGINCISAIESLYRHDGTGVRLTRVFEFIRDAFGNVSGSEHASAAMVKAVNWLLERHAGEFDRQRMVDKLGVMGAKNIRTQAIAHKSIMGGAIWTNYYRAFVEAYNDGLTQANKLETRTGGWASGQRDAGGGGYQLK